MITIVDTSVWSIALRRVQKQIDAPPAMLALRKLVTEGQPIGLPGIVLQELLSGVRTDAEFERLREVLNPFGVIYAQEEHHLEAARIFNRCRSKGVATTAPDALIAATVVVERGRLLTCDWDYSHMARAIGLNVEMVEP